ARKRYGVTTSSVVGLQSTNASEQDASALDSDADDRRPTTDDAVAVDAVPPSIRERIDYELEVITKLGYSGYFLITADFIQWARDRGIPVGPGRGSAAGSIVAYC